MVNRCICGSVDFKDALRVARSMGFSSVRDLQSALPVGIGCGLCVPYMQMAIETGLSNLPVLDAAHIAALLERSGTAPATGEQS